MADKCLLFAKLLQNAIYRAEEAYINENFGLCFWSTYIGVGVCDWAGGCSALFGSFILFGVSWHRLASPGVSKLSHMTADDYLLAFALLQHSEDCECAH